MGTSEIDSLEYAANVGFLIGGLMVIAIIGGLWLFTLKNKATRQYPLIPMLGVAFVAQAIGVFAFLT